MTTTDASWSAPASAKPVIGTAGMVQSWRLDELAQRELGDALDDLLEFVLWLTYNDIQVPDCWYSHGNLRHRLAAFMGWWDAAETAGEAAIWWREFVVLTESTWWRDALSHGGEHPVGEIGRPEKMPKFDVVREQLLARADESPRGFPADNEGLAEGDEAETEYLVEEAPVFEDPENGRE